LDEGKNWKSEIIVRSLSGVIVGITVAVVAFLLLNIWFLLFSPVNNTLALLTTVAVWTGYGMLLILRYKILCDAIYKNIVFLVIAIIVIGLMNNIYNMLAYGILPYSSLETIRIMALVSAGVAIGFMIKIIVEPKKEEAKEIAQ
jgi:hypothetical protein